MSAKLLALRPLELELLMTLLAEPGRVFSREDLMRAVWDIEHGSLHTVDVHVRSLRIDLGGHADQVETVSGFGYRARRGLSIHIHATPSAPTHAGTTNAAV